MSDTRGVLSDKCTTYVVLGNPDIFVYQQLDDKHLLTASEVSTTPQERLVDSTPVVLAYGSYLRPATMHSIPELFSRQAGFAGYL